MQSNQFGNTTKPGLLRQTHNYNYQLLLIIKEQYYSDSEFQKEKS